MAKAYLYCKQCGDQILTGTILKHWKDHHAYYLRKVKSWDVRFKRV